MNKSLRNAALAALLMTGTSAAVVTVLEPAFAGQARAPQARRQVGLPLNDAQKLVDAKDFAGAMAKVQEADAVTDKTPFEDFMVAKFLGFVAINQPMPDYPLAQAAYNRQIASGGIPDAEKPTVYSISMRLNYQGMDYAGVIRDATELQKIQPLDETGYLVLIQAYYNSMDYPNAATTAKDHLARLAAAGMPPSEDVLGLLLNAQVRSMDEAGARVTLDTLASVSDKPEVWTQVVDLTIGTQGLTEHHLLNIYRLSMLTETMKPTDYAAMASIDLQNGLPAEAKAALTKGNQTGELLTQANQFLQNDQAALPALAAEAAKQTNGEIDVKLGESYWSYNRFDEAIAAIQRGIQKGGLRDQGDAITTLGIVLLSAGRAAEALAEFEKAEALGGPGAQVAHIWSLYAKRAMA